MSHQIHTSRLFIRSVHPSESRKYATINELRDDRDAVATILEWNYHGAIQLFVIKRGEGAVVGFIQILPERGGKSGFSFRTAPSHRGQSYMKEAVAAVFYYCFNQLGRRDLFTETRADNRAVIALMGSLGLGRFARTGYAWGNTASRTYTFGMHSWNLHRR
jgi:RimJ/RimL family protein N-acetyltransferase